VTDFRSDRMESPEGKGIARRAWDAYASAVESSALAQTLARKMAVPLATDLLGFWLLWHLEGGFEGMRRLGMSRATIYRRIKLFRTAMGVHPDEYEMPGVTLDVAAYSAWAGQRPLEPAQSQS
jgi:hypothetical protein